MTNKVIVARKLPTYFFETVLMHYKQTGDIEEKADGSLQCLCPFHDDHNPSLNVDPDENLWWCFSCSEGGNIFQFVAKIEGISNKEAIDVLKEIHGYSKYSMGGLRSKLTQVNKVETNRKELRKLHRKMFSLNTSILQAPIHEVWKWESVYRNSIKEEDLSPYEKYSHRAERFFQRFWNFIGEVSEYEVELSYKNYKSKLAYKKDILELTVAVKSELMWYHVKLATLLQKLHFTNQTYVVHF